MGHFVSSSREREKRVRRDSRGNEMKERDRGEGKMNDSEEIEEITRGPRATTRSPE